MCQNICISLNKKCRHFKKIQDLDETFYKRNYHLTVLHLSKLLFLALTCDTIVLHCQTNYYDTFFGQFFYFEIWCNCLCFCIEFHIVVCGLDSVVARRWMNGMLVCIYFNKHSTIRSYKCIETKSSICHVNKVFLYCKNCFCAFGFLLFSYLCWFMKMVSWIPAPLFL